MRRAAFTGLVVVALASGCGGGSAGGGNTGGANAGGQKTVAAASGVTDGRVGDAVVARPGELKVTGHTRKIPGRAALPPSNKHALGAEQNCADADLQPTTTNLAHVSDVVFCLMNAMRENNGLPDLTQQAQLAKASVDHSQDMVTNKYFAHDSPDGRDVVARLTEVQYIPKDGDWVVGENLAWGSGGLATPRALVNAWMNSPPHRENLLSGDYKEVGMGVVFGTPSADASDGVTVTTDFGTRSGGGGGAATSSSSNGSSAGTPGSNVLGTSAKSSAKRKRALRRCSRRHGRAKRRCVRAARRIR
jgi:uncharacterized protein YkwD